MFDNPQSGSNSMQDAMNQMKANREANQPDPVLSETTGGTEGAEQPQVAETSQPEEFQLEAQQDGVQDAYEQEGDETPSRYTVKVGGEEKEVSLDELQSGYMMHSDYTRKTMAHAESVKEFEAKQAQFDQERMTKLQELESFIESQEQTIDWESLRDTDPKEYIRLQEQQKSRKEAAAKERAELEQKQLEQRQAYISEQAAKLEELMGPTWTQERKSRDFDQATEYLQSMGVSEAEIGNLGDARFWMMVFDAMNYRSIQKNKDYVSNEVKKAPKSVKPGQTRRVETDVDKARANLKSADKFTADRAAVALLKAKRGK